MIPLSKERLDMAAYTFSYHMNGGCVLETDPFRVMSMFERHCSGTDLKNIHLVIVHPASRKIVNADFFSRSCLQNLHTFTRTKVTKTKIKLCGTFSIDLSILYIHLWSFQNDPWYVSS
jgi:hypothetical protein